jgi:copper homeostasis protein
MKYELEVIAFDIASCKIASENGANRIELCANPSEGGTTPSYGMIKEARKATELQLFPIIRPRGGDFLYSDEEFDIMLHDIEMTKTLGVDGVVIGMLMEDGSIDMERCSKLITAAAHMEVTFHRAFDRTNNMLIALEQVIALGCKRILTSGLHPTVDLGIDNLKLLVEKSADRIIIMPGSGVRSTNITELAKNTGAIAFHSSARKNISTNMEYINPNMIENLVYSSIDQVELGLIKYNLEKHFMSK